MGRIQFNQLIVAIEDDTKASWYGIPDGKLFRCHLCGHKIQIGETFLVLYTNDNPEASGNPLICGKCYCNDVTGLKFQWIDKLKQAEEQFFWLRPEV